MIAVTRRSCIRQGLCPNLLIFIILQLSLIDALELPAELMLDGVSLLQYQNQHQHPHHASAHAYEERAFSPSPSKGEDNSVNDEVDLPPLVMSAVSEGAQAENLATNNIATETHEHEGEDYDNMAAKLRQPPIWLQLHDDGMAMHQQPDYNKQPHHQQHATTNSGNTFVKLSHQHKHNTHSSYAPTAATVTAKPPQQQRHCAIEITTKLTGVCQEMTPIGSACVAGDYMDVYNFDCM